MMVLLGVGDLLAAAVLASQVFKVESSWMLVIVFGIYLLVKTFSFEINFPGVIDFTAGILILLSFLTDLPKTFSIIIILLLTVKAIRSFNI